jgi:hypothetical protein
VAAGRISFHENDFETQCQTIVLAPDVVSYYSTVVGGYPRWHTVPLSRVIRISWDEDPFTQPENLVYAAADPMEIDYLRQFIANLSPDELEAAVESLIGEGGSDKLGEWIKTALLRMVGE